MFPNYVAKKRHICFNFFCLWLTTYFCGPDIIVLYLPVRPRAEYRHFDNNGPSYYVANQMVHITTSTTEIWKSYLDRMYRWWCGTWFYVSTDIRWYLVYRHPVEKDGTPADNIETINAGLALPWKDLYDRDDTQHCPIVITLYVINFDRMWICHSVSLQVGVIWAPNGVE